MNLESWWSNMQLDQEEKAKKAIPSRVFANHFHAIAYKIKTEKDRLELNKGGNLNRLKLKNNSLEIKRLQQLLGNAWSTEYAFQIAREIDNDDYYKFSIHWSFPQAYYSVYLAMTAFHETQGVANDKHEKSIKIFGNEVKDGHYPSGISFYCSGLYEDFQFHGLNTFSNVPQNFSVLSNINSINDAENQIATFLKSTRQKNAKHKRERLATANDKKFHTSKGRFRKNFKKEHWDIIYQSIPQTTICNMLYRLRIKANYHDVDTFINADINFEQFHANIGTIVSYLNFVHESYICKIIGLKDYEKIINAIPERLIKNTAKKRFDNYIKPLFL